MRSFLTLLAITAAASAANLPGGTTTSTFATSSALSSSTFAASTSTATGVPPSFPTCAVYYGWDDTLSTATLISYTSTAPYGSTVYFDASTTSGNSAPTSTALAKRENWSVSSSQPVTITATVYPTTYIGPSPTGTGIPPPPPCSYFVSVSTRFSGGAPTSSVTASSPGSTNKPQDQAQGQDQGPGNTGAGFMVSASVGAVSLFGAIGVALVL